MKLSEMQIQRLVRRVIDGLKDKKVITFKSKEDLVLKKGVEIIQNEFKKEEDLDREVHRMMDQLEKQNAGEFQRHKMFPLMKKRLAKEKGIIL